MPRRAPRSQTLFATVLALMPAWVLCLAALVIPHPLSLLVILVANALTMVALAQASGFDAQPGWRTSAMRGGVAHFVVATLYLGLVAALLAAPLWWLMHAGSLPAALALSASGFVALLVAWRLWPTFALPLIWDDAYPAHRPSGLGAALARSLDFARHLTGSHETFLVHSFPAGVAVLLLTLSTLAMAGFGSALSTDLRNALVVVHAFALAPLLLALVLNRTLRALLAGARRRRRREDDVADLPIPEAATPALPAAMAESFAPEQRDATLHRALQAGQIELALAALEQGADPDAAAPVEGRDQRSPLMLAAALADLRPLRALIARGADVNRAIAGTPPLVAAARDGHAGRPDAVTMLLANGADVAAVDGHGNTALHHAARAVDPGLAALLIDAGIPLDAVNAEGMTALGIAAAHARWDTLALLLERRAKVEVTGAQPALLHAASIAEDDVHGVRLLLRHRAMPDATGPMQRTALMAAALAGHARIIDVLLAGGADAARRDHRGTTALMEAARSGNVAAIRAFGKRKVDANGAEASGRTALMIACQSRHPSDEAVRALLDIGAERGIVGGDGRRAVDLAAAAGRWSIVALLDPAYPRPSTLDATSTPMDASAAHLLDALRFGHWAVVEAQAEALAGWSADEWAELYLELSDARHAEARAWLLRRGCAGDGRLPGGETLFEALLSRLPATTQALGDLVARGAPVGGAGLLARVLAAASDADSSDGRTLARALHARGADPFGHVDARGNALLLAVTLGDLVLTQDLLDAGSDPDACDGQARTSLHLALRHPLPVALPLIRLLLAAGADPERAAATGETPLGLALARKQPELARWLQWQPWRLPGRRLREADLPAAAVLGDLEAVQRLRELGLPLDGVDAQGATALIRAAGSGNNALVVALLDLGARPVCLARSGVHCLAAAVAAKREATVRTLLNHGVAVDLPMANAATALTVAAAIGDERIAHALLEAGANPNHVDESGITPLLAAARHAFASRDSVACQRLFGLLLAAGARLDACNAAGQDALLLLLGASEPPGTRCDADHLRRLVEDLIERGVRIDAQDRRGVSALHACALHGLFGCARLLKLKGAALDLEDGFGRTAAAVAARLGYIDVAAELAPHAPAPPIPGVRQTLRRPARAPE